MKRVMQLAVILSMIAAPVFTSEVTAQAEYENKHVICLAKNIYFEARGSSFADQAAVADVVMNRVEHDSYPDTICDVVYQGRQDSNGNMIRHQCQFSWYCDGKSDKIPANDTWWAALDIASDMYFNDTWRGLTEGSTHYHANYVKPAWRHNLTLIGRIGVHIFYRQR
jgi:spore germination cell wall hydrolase CwlJ-like protein